MTHLRYNGFSLATLTGAFSSLELRTPPGLKVESGQQGKVVRLSGQWTAFALAR
ncbi:MAG: hypothetical protein CBARDCOR_5770 [uncultured Caballeronia sp.]|nr:MAG: hypothetical protein CBARDCOR_5770 [uncultured Caballeronia sp.]